MNTARRGLGGGGTQTSAIGFGGSTGSVTAATELWNGTSWTNNPTGLGTARTGVSQNFGTQSSSLAAGGNNGTNNVSSTEEWNTVLTSNKTVTVT